MTRRRGFTLIELLFVIGIIGLLIGLIAVALVGVRRAASRTDSLASLRQLSTAYATYSTDHQQRLLPGYVSDPWLGTLRLKATNAGGNINLNTGAYCAGGVCDSSPWLWRLGPYFDYEWKVATTDYQSSVMDAQFEFEVNEMGVYGPGSFQNYGGANPVFGVASIPSFGLNSVLVGGDTLHATNDVYANPWDDGAANYVKLAARRVSEVKNPAKLITFGASAYYDQSALPGSPQGDATLGYMELRAPYLSSNGADWDLPQWSYAANADTDGKYAVDIANLMGDFSQGGGIPVARNGEGKIPVASMDGSAALEELGTLGPSTGTAGNPNLEARIMSRWSPFQVSNQ